jgi:hypothetical protein
VGVEVVFVKVATSTTRDMVFVELDAEVECTVSDVGAWCMHMLDLIGTSVQLARAVGDKLPYTVTVNLGALNREGGHAGQYDDLVVRLDGDGTIKSKSVNNIHVTLDPHGHVAADFADDFQAFVRGS